MDTTQSALILVDIQNDFLPGGPLAVGGGDQIIAVANRLMAKFDCVVATQDWHPADHLSFAGQHSNQKIGDVIDLDGLPQVLWPDHCIQHTLGAEFASELDLPPTTVVFQKGTDRGIDSYSGFFDNGQRKSTGLRHYLTKSRIRRVYVLGLATDYCVKFTACDAAALGFETCLIRDGCRGVNLNPGDIDRAIDAMQAAGVNVCDSDLFD